MNKKRVTPKNIRLLLCVLFTALVMLIGTALSVSAAEEPDDTDTCTVYYHVYSGGVFDKEQVTSGTRIVMKDFSDDVYQCYGWADRAHSTKIVYKLGQSVAINKDMHFYQVRYPKLTISFRNPNGRSDSDMKALTQTVTRAETFKLPAVPAVAGYINLGWSTSKYSTSARFMPGRVLTVKKDTVFFAVRQKASCKVTFSNNSGRSTSEKYTSLNQYAVKNSSFRLPKLPRLTGYTAVGWTTAQGKTTPLYKAGSTVKITRSTKFYAVYSKAKRYTVTFYAENGKTDSTYRKLQKTVVENTVIPLPTVPSKKGYVNLGWTTVRGTGTVKRAGTNYRVKRDTVLYASQEKSVSVILHYSSGKVYNTINIGMGDSFRLPGVGNGKGCTFMGWATTPNQTVNPKYEVGDRIKVTKTVHLYAVVFRRTIEENPQTLKQADLGQYKQVIFVGDSRTVRMETTLRREFGASGTQGVKFIGQGGQGLTWLQNIGTDTLLSAVGNGTRGKPTAVIFNLGVNDLSRISEYVPYMTDLARTLKKKNCRLFYMSVNPLNNKIIEKRNSKSRPEETVRRFNATVRSSLGGNYTFIDTYSWLMKTGYSTDSGPAGYNTGVDDGLHYAVQTYKRIYNYCINTINKY